MIEPIPFPFQDTLGGGDYRITEELRRGGWEQLYLGTRAHHPGSRYLISVSAQSDMPIAKLRGFPEVAGVFAVEHVGRFDELGVDPARDAERRSHYAMIEKLPPGDPIARLVTAPLAPRVALELGAAVAAIALEASRHDVILDGLRPDYVWARRDGDALAVTGIGSRNRAFFACARPRSFATQPLFDHAYTTPEQLRGDPAGATTPVFLIATMIAEWLTGAFPFATRDELRAGTPRSVEAAPMLAAAFAPDPRRRMSLAGLVAALRC